MKKVVALMLALSVVFALCGCGHEHTWKDATCTEPKTCSECGATEGEALGHTWKEATCTEPKTCSVCGATEGEAVGHKWEEATSTKPKTCSVCGKTEGDPLPAVVHFFEEYPNLRTPDYIWGITLKEQKKEKDEDYYYYSMGSDISKAEDYLGQYASDALVKDGYLIIPYQSNRNYYAIYYDGTDITNIKGLITFGKDGDDILMVIGLIK